MKNRKCFVAIIMMMLANFIFASDTHLFSTIQRFNEGDAVLQFRDFEPTVGGDSHDPKHIYASEGNYEYVTYQGNTRFLDDIDTGPVYWDERRAATIYPYHNVDEQYDWPGLELSFLIRSVFDEENDLRTIRVGDILYYTNAFGRSQNIALVVSISNDDDIIEPMISI
jgi:hypothetical protein